MKKSNIAPVYLRPGDSIGLISTARKISESETEFAVTLLENWGFKVVLGKHLYGAKDQFSGTDQERAADLQMMLDRRDIRAIICARGGYGTVRILDRIDFKPLLEDPKWLAGYSDVTALHACINHRMGIQSIHSTMPINFPSNTQEALESLRMALTGELTEYNFESPDSPDLAIEAELGGGNLSIIYSLSGSEDAWKPSGGLLFLEDLDEYLYHIDRMMMNLRRNGMLNGLQGIILGGMSDMNDNQIPFGKSAIDIIREHGEAVNIPVVTGFPAGHLIDNRSLFLGRQAHLSVKNGGAKLQFQ